MSGITSMVASYHGSQAQKDASKKASEAAAKTASKQDKTLRYMFDESNRLQEPFRTLGVEAIDALRSSQPTAGAERYMDRLQSMAGPNLPQLDIGQFNYQFDPNDPTYLYRQQEMERTINQAAAARGNYNSRAAINALGQGNMALTADESERQFGRAMDSYRANTETGLAQYAADYGRAGDLYRADYGKFTDLYNMNSQVGNQQYQQLLDQIKIGQGSAAAAGTGAMSTGQGLAQVYGNLGQSLQQNLLTQGQVSGDLWGNVGAQSNNALMSYLLYKGMGSKS